MLPILQGLSGSVKGELFPLLKPSTRIGRSEDCDIRVNRPAVSRFHAEIRRERDHVVLIDTASKNKTWVNGRATDGRTVLADQDRIRVCDAVFLFRELSEDRPPPREPLETVPAEGPMTVLATLDARLDSLAQAADGVSRVGLSAQERLPAILRFSRSLTLDLADDRLLDQVLAGLLELFPAAERALLFLLDEAGKPVPRATLHRYGTQPTVPFSRSLVKHVLNERVALLTGDSLEDLDIPTSKSIVVLKLRSVMCVPILGREREPLGALQLDSQRTASLFTQDDLAVLTAVASQTAIALETARLHEELLLRERVRAQTDAELRMAQLVQSACLPDEPPRLAGYTFWSHYAAAFHVGGDFYDFVPLPDGRLVLFVGDVSGKGVPAAIFMAKIGTEARNAFERYPDDPAAAMKWINQRVCQVGRAQKYVTMVSCVLDPTTHQLAVVKAGHMSPIIRRTDGSLEEPAPVQAAGAGLGFHEDAVYDVRLATIEPGETVVMYTDGVTDAMNADDELYGLERLRHRIARSGGGHPSELGGRILSEIAEHVGECPPTDDTTLIVFQRESEPAAEEPCVDDGSEG